MKPIFALLAAAVALMTGRALTQEPLNPDSASLQEAPHGAAAGAAAGATAGAASGASLEKSALPPADFAERIKSAVADREKRLIALNEAMLRLREAGETEEAARIQERLEAMIEALSGPVMSDVPSGASPVVAELNAMKARQDELMLQVRGLQEQMKRIGAEDVVNVQPAEPAPARSSRSR